YRFGSARRSCTVPKLTKKLPSYRHHKVSGQAIVTLAGRDHYLGAHGSPESIDAYKRLIGEWTAAGPATTAASIATSRAGSDFRMRELPGGDHGARRGY